MSTKAKPKALSVPEAGATPTTVKLHPLRSGEMHSPRRFIELEPGIVERLQIGVDLIRRGGRWYWVPIPAFLIEHPTEGLVLVDTGMHESVATDPAISFGPLGKRLYGTRFTAADSVPSLLRARGFDPADVKTVVMTHLHIDHASGIQQFPNAKFVVHEVEWDAANSRGSELKGYRKQQFDFDYDWQTYTFSGPNAKPLGPFTRSLDLFGDGSVTLLNTPGHTRGHVSLLLALADRQALLTGDASYLRATIDRNVQPVVADNRKTFNDSLARVRTWVRDNPQALIIPGHDPGVWETLEASY